MHLLPGKRFTTMNTIYHADAMDLLANLPDDSVNLIATDPPYFKVKAAAWDHQWDDTSAYLQWLDGILAECKRVLVPNGSLYIFASPQMAARVEIAVSKHLRVLNSLVWSKPHSRHNQASTEDIRGFFPQTERIIFAEHGNSDVIADDIAGYTKADRELKRRLFGLEIERAMQETNTNTHDLVEAVGAYRKHNNGGAASNWTAGYNIPTPEQYQKMRDYLNGKANGKAYLVREYEDLRREYEDLRRPFNSRADRPYTDVWTYKTVSAYEGKHECEKPLDMMKHIVEISSRPGDVVLDLFAGSGATMDAARQTGRKWIGCDADVHWANYANRRLEKPYNQMLPIFEEAA